MAVELKSILKQIPWFLVTKAIALGLAWLYLPFWVFLGLALLVYFFPFFKSWRFILPFGLLLLLTSPILATKSIWFAILIAWVFFFILGVKDLILINRRSGYSLMTLGLIFILFFTFFTHIEIWSGWAMFFGSLVLALFFFFLLIGLTRYDDFLKTQEKNQVLLSHGWLSGGVVTFLIWQMTWVLNFMPFNPFYRAILLFVTAGVLIEITLAYLAQKLTQRKILINFSILFVFSIFILMITDFNF